MSARAAPAPAALPLGRIRRLARLLAAGLAVAIVVPPAAAPVAPPAAAEPRELLPTEHWAYRDFERLWARGLVDSLNLAARPWSRQEGARILARALADPAVPAGDPALRRLVRELGSELHRLDPERFEAGPAAVWTVSDDTSTVRWSLGAQLMTTEDEPDALQLAEESRGFVQVRASLPPHLFATSEVRAQRTGSARNIGDSLVKDEDFYLDAGESYVSLSPAAAQLVVGYIRNRWGPGPTGTLLLSDAAPPFATLRWETSLGGELAFTALSGVLADPDHRYLAAHRITWTPTESLAIGVAEAARYDARSLELLYVLNLMPYTIVERVSSKTREEHPEVTSRNNVMMSADVVWRVRRGTRLTAEFLLDDLATESASMPHRMGYQLGAEQWLAGFPRPVGVSAEFTKVFRYTYSTFYDRDYIHADRPLGYALGPDTENLNVELRIEAGCDWAGWLGGQLSRRGETGLGEAWQPGSPSSPWDAATLSGTVETETAIRLGVELRPRADAWADLVVGYHHTVNDGHVADVTSDTFEVRAALSFRR